jgi:hypothetical protein
MVGALVLATFSTWQGFQGRNGRRREWRCCGAWAAAFDPVVVSCSEIEQSSFRKFVGRTGREPTAVGHFFEVFLFHRSTAGPFGEAAACGGGLSSRDRMSEREARDRELA